jgi:hypothetical protein
MTNRELTQTLHTMLRDDDKLPIRWQWGVTAAVLTFTLVAWAMLLA